MRTGIWALLLIVVGLAIYLVNDRLWPEARGTLAVISDPPGAEILVDLYSTNLTTPATVPKLRRGRHSVTLRKDGFVSDPVVHIAVVRANQVDTVRFVLLPIGGKPHALSGRGSMPDSLRNQKPPEDSRASIMRDSMVGTSKVGDQLRTIPSTPMPQSRSPSVEQKGVLEISSTIPGAIVRVNGLAHPDPTPVTLSLDFGTYVISVEMPGYTSDPLEQTVRINRSVTSQSVHFTLTPSQSAVKLIKVETKPVSGVIYLNGEAVGEGSVTLSHDYGVYSVTFGEVDGWRTPPAQRIALTPAKPAATVTGVYTRKLNLSAEIEAGGTVRTNGAVSWQVGIVVEGKRQVSSMQGARIRDIPGSSKWGWELAIGDQTRNPPGGDYVEFTFDLPEDVSPSVPVNLRLYLYRSANRYPIELVGRSEIVVTVNDRPFLDGYRPRFGIESADSELNEEWTLQGMLNKGQNRILVRAGDRNTVFNYLWKIEII